ncbi:F-box protein CPR1-like [Cicer arietinum]|uniref:F-box protein CPR1-like n=1 Tax=Cicer arietinum TaxID=3827 RepID=UPI003CC6064E
MEEEVKEFKRNDVWDLLLRPKKNIIESKWVFINKLNENCEVVKKGDFSKHFSWSHFGMATCSRLCHEVAFWNGDLPKGVSRGRLWERRLPQLGSIELYVTFEDGNQLYDVGQPSSLTTPHPEYHFQTQNTYSFQNYESYQPEPYQPESHFDQTETSEPEASQPELYIPLGDMVHFDQQEISEESEEEKYFDKDEDKEEDDENDDDLEPEPHVIKTAYDPSFHMRNLNLDYAYQSSEFDMPSNEPPPLDASLEIEMKFNSKPDCQLAIKHYHIKHSFNYRVVQSDQYSRLLKNTSITLADDPYLQDLFLHEFHFPGGRRLHVVGSCNGLLCLYGYVSTFNYEEIFLYLWNPATKTLSSKIVFLHDEFNLRKCARDDTPSLDTYWNFWFGYDNSTDTYKIVAFCRKINDVRVYNLGDDVWRNIQSFPVVPFRNFATLSYTHLGINDGAYVSGTVNWLAIRNVCPYNFDLDLVTIDQFVIISLDLSTETYNQFQPPHGFDEVTSVEPTLTILMDSLCFSHDFPGTHFIIWQMKEFGVEESWTQFLKITHQSLPIIESVMENIYATGFFPLCLSENGDTLILAWDEDESAILYNLRDNRGEKTRISNQIQWFCAKNYVESLVSTSSM